MNKSDFAGLTALVIDDEYFMRRLLSALLHDIGFSSVVTTEDGAEGLNRIESTTHAIDVVICDLEMPLVNGFEFIAMLRASREADNPNIPVVIVTGHSEERHVHDAVKLGIHGFLVKPISHATLERRVRQALQSEPIDPEQLAQKPQPMLP
ncbi:response regulator [Varunaivibrio sulfuroxidans]|uniref:Two-component system chemotaxis response regulator CheY n=1 Tax=Varunaivibrio sulfuroxidans TaxID=1773489 RepID=A0A4R3JAF5_9PROT|nr:response regulator [Varunaivibrio sulfuroxidans]TCS62524.1 two-component system chemotaxis response regulator CheY [Varunaivibrio sulfuroxidans]WES30805.1 response regulator [Varunaivibrio sulfuroxidans]